MRQTTYTILALDSDQEICFAVPSTATKKQKYKKPSPLATAIRIARHALGWTQDELANQSGVSPVTIARMEAAMTSPTISTMLKLQQVISKSGIHITINEPDGGFTLRVFPSALSPNTDGPKIPKKIVVIE